MTLVVVPPAWLGKTPSGAEFERMPLEWFHAAIDQQPHPNVSSEHGR